MTSSESRFPNLLDFAQSFRRMAEQIVRQRRQQAEMASAAAIQRAMLPSGLPTSLIEGRFDIHIQIKPAREVGGDFYDIIPLDENRIAIHHRRRLRQGNSGRPLHGCHANGHARGDAFR